MLNLVRKLRVEHGLTQEELASRVKVSRQTIISIESGRYSPSIMLAYRIARCFGMSIEGVFLCEAEEKGAPPDVSLPR
ncbi:MAG: helix-turn-helix transcriptional regulator [Bacillota bacterium]